MEYDRADQLVLLSSKTFVFLIISAVVLFGLKQLQQWQSLRRRKSRYELQYGCEDPPSYPHIDPIFGLDSLWRNVRKRNEHMLLPEMAFRYREYGNTYSIIFGGRRALATIDSENLRTILSTNFTSFGFGSLRTNALKPLLGDSIFTSSGPAWQHSRTMLRPKFETKQFVDAEMMTFEKHMDAFVSRIPRDGSEVDLQPLFFSYTLNAALEFLTGLDMQSSAGDDITKIFNDAENHIGEELLLPSFVTLGRLRREYVRKCKICHDWLEEHIQRVISDQRDLYEDVKPGKNDSSRKKWSFLQELIEDTDDVEKIRSELLSILLAGRETTASTLSSLWFVLAKRPDVVKKLQAEMDELDSCKPDFTRLKTMRYLQNTIKEVLRLYPALPGNLRAATEDTMLPVGGGPDGKSPVFVSKGQVIVYNVYSMHRRQDIFGADADIFRPERWEDNSLRPGWGYLPFNGGPRICLGQQFAMTEVAYTTVRLLQEFRSVQARDDSPWQEEWLINCAVKTGCKVSLTPRNIL